MNFTSLAVAVSLVVVVTAQGCAPDTSDTGSEDSLAQGETFKLYEELKPQVNPGCDRYTEMRIKNSRLVPGMLVVDLEDKLASTSVCELKIAPNRRQFKVKQSAKDSCGSLPSRGNGQAIEGEQLVGASIPVEIFDHRSRLCEDLRAPVEVRVGTGSNQCFLHPKSSRAAMPRQARIAMSLPYVARYFRLARRAKCRRL
jgi:hypothetical protein